jgi:hypothetical protein
MYMYQYKELPQFHNFIYFPRLTPISETLLSFADTMIAVARAPEFFAPCNNKKKQKGNKKPGTKGIMNTQKNRNNNTESFISKAFRLHVFFTH